jgi:hypothetical protein
MNVDHIKTNKNGMTKLVVSLPITQRQGLADLSGRLRTSQQTLIRSAVARLLEDNKPKSEPQSKPQPRTKRGRKRGVK